MQDVNKIMAAASSNLESQTQNNENSSGQATIISGQLTNKPAEPITQSAVVNNDSATDTKPTQS